MNITKRMIYHYYKRTLYHIELVKKYAEKIYELFMSECPDLLEQVKEHDKNKFVQPSIKPYIKITWNYKCKKEGKTIEFSEKEKTQMNKITEYHVNTNKHHPEYWCNKKENLIDPNDRDGIPKEIIDATKMNKTSLCEMVADWLAMSEELNSNVFDWAEKNINKRWKFTDEQVELIYKILNTIRR